MNINANLGRLMVAFRAILGSALLACWAFSAQAVESSAEAAQQTAAIAAQIDARLDAALAAADIEPSAPASDEEFLRRAFADLVGTIPSAEEASRFIDDTHPAKRAALVDRLLADERYGRHFAAAWEAILLPEDSQAKGFERTLFTNWLAAQFNAGRGWNAIVREMLACEGALHETPPAVYTLANVGMNRLPSTMTTSVTRSFLGVSMECAECHDHPTRPFTQADFWGIAAFFSRAKFDKPAKNAPPVTLPPEVKKLQFLVEPVVKLKKDQQPGHIDITDQDRVVHGAARATFLKSKSPELSMEQPFRPVLAEWLTAADNPYFAKAAANRAWAHFLGRGLIHPVDDLRETEAGPHVATLELLAAELARSDFDLKHLARVVTSTKAYHRSGVPQAKNLHDTAHFGRPSVKVMPPRVLLAAVEQAFGGVPLSAEKVGVEGAENAWRTQFLTQFKVDDPEAGPADYVHGIPQALRLMNAELLGQSPALGKILAAVSAPHARLEAMYLATLSRRPTSAETARLTKYVEASDDPTAAYRDVYWMLLNCSEFTLVP